MEKIVSFGDEIQEALCMVEQTNMTEPIQQAWLNVIQESLQVLHAASQPAARGRGGDSHYRSNSQRKPRHKEEEEREDLQHSWDQSLRNLATLETFLLERHSHPASHQEEEEPILQVGLLTLDTAPNELPPVGPTKQPEQDDQAAGDEVLLQPSQLVTATSAVAMVGNPARKESYTARRLLIRIYTGLADLYVGYGRYLDHESHKLNSDNNDSRIDRQKSKIETWTQVASLATLAFEKGQAGLLLADSAVSLWFQEQEQLLMEQQQAIHEHFQQQNDQGEGLPSTSNMDPTDLLQLKQQVGGSQRSIQLSALTQDAEIVAVAIHQLVSYKERLEHDISRERSRLQNRLRPQWKTRDQVKQRLGTNYWYNNPAPKHDHSALREEDEAALRQLDDILNQMQLLQIDALSQSAYNLQQRLEGVDDNLQQPTGMAMSQLLQEHEQQQLQRHNGLRPGTTSRTRVSREDFPDPNILNNGWAFTGSEENLEVEYYEFELTSEALGGTVSLLENNGRATVVQLDWFYTKATVKTTLYVPSRQGHAGRVVPLIVDGTRVTPSLYRSIIENPCTKTSKNGAVEVVASASSRRTRGPDRHRGGNSNHRERGRGARGRNRTRQRGGRGRDQRTRESGGNSTSHNGYTQNL